MKIKVEKAQTYLGLTSTAIGIVGAVGTCFVWLVGNFCTGTLEIQPDKPVEAVMVKVVDKKGQQQTYYSRWISLMPGDYHIEFGVPDKKPTKHTDAHINFWQSTVIPYAVPDELASLPQPEPKKRWWQFWRRETPQTAESK